MIEILDSFLKKVDILRKYTYAQYTEEFRGIGSFKINVPIIEENKYLLDETEQYYVLFDTKRNGKNKKILGVVDKVEKEADSDYDNQYTLSGRMVQFVLKNRVTKGTFSYSGNTANFVSGIIYDNILKNKDDRYIPISISLENATKLNSQCSKIDKQVTGGYIWDEIEPVLEQDGLGLIIEPNIITEKVIDGNKTNIEGLSLTITLGADRRKWNKENNVSVVFSQSLSNISRTSYTRDTTNYTNVAYTAGEGEEESRKWYEIEINSDVKSKNKKGIGRRELWIDARDIQSVQDDKTLTDKEYETLIKQRTNEKAAEAMETRTYESTLTEQNKQYVFGIDYNIGDWCTVIDSELEKVLDVQIVTIVHTIQGTGTQEIIDVGFSYGLKQNMDVLKETRESANKIENNNVNIKYLDNKQKTLDNRVENLENGLKQLPTIPADEFTLSNVGEWYKYGKRTFIKLNGLYVGDVANCPYPPKGGNVWQYVILLNMNNGTWWHGFMKISIDGSVSFRTIASIGATDLYDCTGNNFTVYGYVDFFNE